MKDYLGKQKYGEQRKHRSGFLSRCFLWLFLIGAVFVGFGLLARLSSLQVSSFAFENIIVTDTKEIENSLKEYLGGRFLYPRSNRFWFSSRKMEEYVLQKFPRIGEARVSLDRKQVMVWGQEREGFYLWCGREVVSVSLDTPCYFADSTGFIFDTAPYFSGATYTRLYGGNVGEGVVGSQAFPSHIFELHQLFSGTLKPFDLGIQAIYVPEENQLEFLLLSNNEVPKAPRLRHYLLNDEAVVSQNLEKALGQEKVLLDIVTHYDRLEYLDVRFKNQVVYKFFDEATPEEQIELEPETNEESLEENQESFEDQEDIQETIEG